MKNQIAVNTKFFTRTQAKGVMSHVKREFDNDKNVIDAELTKNNFGNKDAYINKNYTEALLAMSDKTKNTLIDSVLVLPVDQVEQVKKDHPKDWKVKIHESIMSMMGEMENEMGFKPLGYKLHLDEGTELDDGTIKLNPHAHLLFANVCVKDVEITKTKKVTQKDENGKAMRDPEKPSKWLFERDEDGNVKTEEVNVQLNGKAPLSHYQQRGNDSVWSKQQDIAAKHLKALGFERGTSKELTKAKHLNKEQHVRRELAKMEKETEAQLLKINSLKAYEVEIESRIDAYFDRKQDLHATILEQDRETFKAILPGVIASFEGLPSNAQESLIQSDIEALNGFEDSIQLQLAQLEIEEKEKALDKPKPVRRKFGM